MLRSLRLPSLAALLVLLCASAASAEQVVVDGQMHHLRSGNEREWSDFSPHAEGTAWQVEFELPNGFKPHVLLLRQRDVKQTWNLSLDDKPLGKLLPDENDTIVSWPLPADLTTGKHKLAARSDGKKSDDVLIGEARILDEAEWKGGNVVVAISGWEGGPFPCRITIATESGSLMAIGAESNEKQAVRPGVIYTADGHAEFTVPQGRYRVYASRGPEYEATSIDVEVRSGESVKVQRSLRHFALTPGYVSCDPHCHTFQFSRHGDATLDERLLTLAGEGIELPIATDHNLQVDYDKRAQELGLRKFFTPVVGSEVTTKVGHFNVFPLKYPSPPIDFMGKDWAAVSTAIRNAGPEVVILNHARDLHSGFRPFGPEHRVEAGGENLDGWTLDANAMEVVNSGATQTDPLLLFRDWMTTLNRGQMLTPVGASDSHDVSRFIVGQGRTYVRCKDENPGDIDIAEALQAFRAGRVMVSMGLFAELRVNDRYQSGDLVPADDGMLSIRARIFGPWWAQASQLQLYLNGELIEARKTSHRHLSPQWEENWKIPRPKHDVHLVAIALGPGVKEPFWAISRPYQPTSDDPTTYLIGCSGAVFIDADRSGRFESAYELAQGIVKEHNRDLGAILARLNDFDLATSIQAASVLQASGISIMSESLDGQLATAAPHVRSGFLRYRESWKQSVAARLNSNPATAK